MISKNKILIVGGGFAGSTIARILAEKNFDVYLIDKRGHIGGNAYDFLNKNGERIHKYGPHLLHGNPNSRAVKFLIDLLHGSNMNIRLELFWRIIKLLRCLLIEHTLEDVYNIKLHSETNARFFRKNQR